MAERRRLGLQQRRLCRNFDDLTHIANLQRGVDTDRALHVHSNLIARETLEAALLNLHAIDSRNEIDELVITEGVRHGGPMVRGAGVYQADRGARDCGARR
jgi:hypothetical protein